MWDVKHQFLESVLRDCQTVVNESSLDFKASLLPTNSTKKNSKKSRRIKRPKQSKSGFTFNYSDRNRCKLVFTT